ncbi:hypothetical protein ACTFRP_11965 [Bacillus cereus group sp. MYBK234-1]
MYKEPFQPTYEYALECDKHDELKDFQTEFYKKESTIPVVLVDLEAS